MRAIARHQAAGPDGFVPLVSISRCGAWTRLDSPNVGLQPHLGHQGLCYPRLHRAKLQKTDNRQDTHSQAQIYPRHSSSGKKEGQDLGPRGCSRLMKDSQGAGEKSQNPHTYHPLWEPDSLIPRMC